MKSVKKMLSLLLVAMLLVTAIPFAASASDIPSAQSDTTPILEGVGATKVDYSILFAVKDTSTGALGYSSTIAVAAVSSDANDDQIRSAAAAAVASAGYSTVTADAIAQKVSANGNSEIVHNVVYGSIRTKIDKDNKQVKYILEVSPRSIVETKDVIKPAKILLDSENTGIFQDTGKTVNVTLVATTSGSTTTYALKSNGGATVTDIKGALGANFNNKTLTMTMQGPSATTGEVTYRVTVIGTTGSTGTNVPNYDDTTNNNNNGIVVGPGDGTSNNTGNSNTGSNSGTIGSGGSAGNGSTGSTGSNTGTNGTTGTVNTPTYSEVPGNVYLEIYTNKNFGSYDARFSITNNSNKNYNIGTDGTVSAERGGDLWNLMASIYTAKDSNGMEVKLYQFEGNNFPVDWAFGNYYTSISNLTAARQNKDITIRVVVNNVYRKTADTSNPKTGDPIMMSVAVLGITACGLAAAYIYSKKRKAV